MQKVTGYRHRIVLILELPKSLSKPKSNLFMKSGHNPPEFNVTWTF